jgi:WNK lysine deficient protein kinase
MQYDEEIGSGAFKVVYRGYDFDRGTEIAWNSITFKNRNAEDLNRIWQEINMMKSLKHPNIIKYVSGWIDEINGNVIIITEIFSGGSLKQ